MYAVGEKNTPRWETEPTEKGSGDLHINKIYASKLIRFREIGCYQAIAHMDIGVLTTNIIISISQTLTVNIARRVQEICCRINLHDYSSPTGTLARLWSVA